MPFYRDHIGANYGMEVVLANGEVMRTGMGAMPNAKTWQEYKYGHGPDPSGLFAQGNFSGRSTHPFFSDYPLSTIPSSGFVFCRYSHKSTMMQ